MSSGATLCILFVITNIEIVHIKYPLFGLSQSHKPSFFENKAYRLDKMLALHPLTDIP